MRVFWPLTGILREEGVVVGWSVRDTLCVVGIVEEWMKGEDRNPKPSPKLGMEKSRLPGEGQICPPLEKVGWAHSSTSTGPPTSAGSALNFRLSKARIPIECSAPITLVLYAPPDPNRIRFLRLSEPRPIDGIETVEKWKVSQDGYGPCSTLDGLDEMDQIVRLINGSKNAQEHLDDQSFTPHSSRGSSQAPSNQESGRSIPSIMRTLLPPLKTSAWSFIHLLTKSTLLSSMRSHSSTIDQICLRLAQTLHTPEGWRRTREVTNASIQERSGRYIIFWNTVWLIANDLILGYCARQIILLLHETLTKQLKINITKYLVELPIAVLRWLDDWPVGLKLNTPLSQFFCTSLGLVVAHWGAKVDILLSHLGPSIVSTIALASFGGLTLTLTAISDLLSVLTLHLYVCHTVMRIICKWQLESLSGLWNLFRGKRWNVLRQRTDSYAYDVDQLFLGTLLFTVSAFLYPTVLVYAALFGLIHIILTGVGKGISSAVGALNAFPLFELMLRMKEPSRLPAGVHLIVHRNIDSKEIVGDQTGEEARFTIRNILELKNSPKTIMEILCSS